MSSYGSAAYARYSRNKAIDTNSQNTNSCQRHLNGANHFQLCAFLNLPLNMHDNLTDLTIPQPTNEDRWDDN